MLTKIIEATNVEAGGINYGKFLLGRPDVEWARRSGVPGPEERLRPTPLLGLLGWAPQHLWVLDLQTGEGAFFLPGGLASADLDKHKIWVCPLFEPFLAWLYTQDLGDLGALPDVVALDAPSALYGYRRKGA